MAPSGEKTDASPADVTPAVLPYAVPPRERTPPMWPTVLDRVIVFGIAAVMVLVGGTGLFAWALAGPSDTTGGVQTIVLSVGVLGGGALAFAIGLRR